MLIMYEIKESNLDAAIKEKDVKEQFRELGIPENQKGKYSLECFRLEQYETNFYIYLTQQNYIDEDSIIIPKEQLNYFLQAIPQGLLILYCIPDHFLTLHTHNEMYLLTFDQSTFQAGTSL